MRALIKTQAVAALLTAAASAQTAHVGNNSINLEGKQQSVYYLPGHNVTPKAADAPVVLAAEGAGRTGLGLQIASTLAAWGHDVYGFDARSYVAGFGRTAPTRETMMADMRRLGEWAVRGRGRKAIFVGYADGADLGVLAVVPTANKQVYRGLVTIDLRPRTATGDLIGPFLAELSPTPIVMIEAGTGDEAAAQRLFTDAREPKLLRVLPTADARFDGNHTGMLDALGQGLAWIADPSR